MKAGSTATPWFASGAGRRDSVSAGPSARTAAARNSSIVQPRPAVLDHEFRQVADGRFGRQRILNAAEGDRAFSGGDVHQAVAAGVSVAEPDLGVDGHHALEDLA